MVRKKLSSIRFAFIVGAIVLISIVLYVIVSGAPQETWIAVGYPSAFFLGLIGAASVIIPVPTTISLLAMAFSRFFDPILLALAFGLGAGCGQLTSYIVGYAGRDIVSEKYERRLTALLKIFERYGMIAVFLFALTPLPDSMLFIPMGMVRYSLLKLFVAAVAGKISMSLIITLVGDKLGGSFAESLAAENWVFAAIIATITAFLVVFSVLMVFKIDWEKVAEKYLRKNKKRK